MPIVPARTNSVNEIINFFSNGIQRTNRFDVSIIKPGGVSDKYWATSVQLPEQAVVFYPESFGPSSPYLNLPLKRTFDERFLIEFIVDASWNVRKYMESWYDLMFSDISTDRSRRVTTRNAPGILRNIEILALNDAQETGSGNNTNARFVLYEAYPKLILPSEMNNDAPNQYLSMIVDFNYRYYKLFPS